MIGLIDNRIRAAFGRVRLGVRVHLERIVVDGAQVLLHGVGLDGEAVRDALLLQQYGLASVPLAGGEALVLHLSPESKVTIATDDGRYRLQGMEAGEVALYTDQGDVVHLKRGGIEIKSSNDVIIEAGGTCTVKGGKVVVDAGDISLGKGAVNKAILGDLFQPVFDNHTHTLPIGVSGPPNLTLSELMLSNTVKVGA